MSCSAVAELMSTRSAAGAADSAGLAGAFAAAFAAGLAGLVSAAWTATATANSPTRTTRDRRAHVLRIFVIGLISFAYQFACGSGARPAPAGTSRERTRDDRPLQTHRI